jgi:hypothetical protein
MKRCAICHKELGLAARFRNVWNGGSWVHIRFCSVLCKAIYQAKRSDAPRSLAYYSRRFAEPIDWAIRHATGGARNLYDNLRSAFR